MANKHSSQGCFVSCVSAVGLQAEGLEQTFSTSLLFEVSATQPSLTRDVTFIFPGDVVEGSERVSVTAVGMLTHTHRVHVQPAGNTHTADILSLWVFGS